MNNITYYSMSSEPLMRSHTYQLWYLIVARTFVVTLIPSGLCVQFLRVARHYGVRDSTHSYPAFVSVAILFMLCHLPRLCESIGAVVFRGNKSVATFMWSISVVFPFSRWMVVLYSSFNLALVIWRDPGLWEAFREALRCSRRGGKDGELYHSNSFIDLGV